MKVKIIFLFIFCVYKSQLLQPKYRELTDKKIFEQIINDKKLMNCIFDQDLQAQKVDCSKLFNYSDEYQQSIVKVQQFIHQINLKEKNCKQILDQNNFNNCKQKIILEIQNQNNLQQNSKNDTSQLIAHVFTGYFNSLNNIEQKNDKTQQDFENFLQNQKSNQKGQTDLQIFIDKNDKQKQNVASKFIKQIQTKQGNTKDIIQQDSPANLTVKMFDHTIQKLSIDEEDSQALDNNSLIDDQNQNSQNKIQQEQNQQQNGQELALINKKIKTYEIMGRSNEMLEHLFANVSKNLDELKREEQRNKVLDLEKKQMDKNLQRDVYSENLQESTQKIQDLRQNITDQLIYAKSLVEQKKLENQIIRRLQSLDQLKKTFVPFRNRQYKQRKLVQKNAKKIDNFQEKYQDQIILYNKELKKDKIKNKKSLLQAIRSQNVQLKLRRAIKKLRKKHYQKKLERKLNQTKDQLYEETQGFEVLESIQQMHSVQQSLMMEEKIKSVILTKLSELINWKDISIKKIQENHSLHHDEQHENVLLKINETYNQQITYMLDALQGVEERKYNYQKKRIKKLQDQRKKLKANQILTENYDVSAFQALEQDQQLQELMEENMKIERDLSKQSNSLQRLRSEFIKNKNEVDQLNDEFVQGLEKNKKQILKKIAQEKAQLVQECVQKNIILFVLFFILIQIIQLQYAIRIII